MTFEELDPEAQNNYAAVNNRMGLSHDFSSHGPIESQAGVPLVFSADPLESHVPPKIISVASIAQMNDMLGVPDHFPDEHIEGPEPLEQRVQFHLSNVGSTNELWSKLTESDIKNVKTAARTYILGNSERVKEYEPLINALMFPAKIAYFACPDDYIIKGPVVVKKSGSTPIYWCYNNIIIEPGGSITSEAEDFKIDCNNFKTVSAAASEYGLEAGTDYKIDISVAGYTKAAPDGTDAGQGNQGPKGDNAVEKQDMGTKGCPWTCVSQAKDGKPGLIGGNGTPGSPGGRGQDQGTFTMTVKQVITGQLIITVGGGNGQDAGRGGNGGPGGPGGFPGDVGVHAACTTKANQGPQGPGGNGAKGGKGGDGGDGNVVTIFYTSIEGGVQPNYVGGLPGNPGKGGAVGPGIPAGGSDGVGDPGGNGKIVKISLKQLPTNQ